MGTMTTLNHSLRALRHRNFRLYFIGHAASTLGTWIQQVALAWLIYRLTGSATLLGVTTCMTLLPQLIVGPFAGAWIDRHDKRRLLIGVEILLGIQAMTLALLAFTEWISPSLLVGMAALMGMLNAFDIPLRQALLSQFVDNRDDLPNALALNAMLFTSSRFVGPPLAGLLLGVSSEALCFLLNGLSYLALVAGLLLMRIRPVTRAAGSYRSILSEGLNYARQNERIRAMMLSVLVINLTASSYAVLLPVFAKDIFAGNATTLGWLWGAAGLGSLLSTVFLASRLAVESLPRAILFASAATAIALLVFAWSDRLVLSLAAMAAIGFGITISNVGTNIVLQSEAPEALRGRVVSLYTSIRFGFDALGGLFVGVLASYLGAPSAMAAAGLVLLLYCLLGELHRRHS